VETDINPLSQEERSSAESITNSSKNNGYKVKTRKIIDTIAIISGIVSLPYCHMFILYDIGAVLAIPLSITALSLGIISLATAKRGSRVPGLSAMVLGLFFPILLISSFAAKFINPTNPYATIEVIYFLSIFVFFVIELFCSIGQQKTRTAR